MKRPHRHLLRVDQRAETFAPLFEAAKDAGLRVGWLVFDAVAPPPALAAAARLGALRAVSVGADGTVAVKPLRGASVLRDVLREHFRGCALVLVRGEVDGVARLEPVGDVWQVHGSDGGAVGGLKTTNEVISALRRPRPW